MDFSLVQAESKHFALRDILALKKRWPYYTIMVVDPIIRFAWIFYAIFTHNRQHSTIVSFLVALMEVIRRGMWSLFRVENEHCANVSQYKASRDVPLPYRIEPLLDRASSENSPTIREQPEEEDEQQRQQQQRDQGRPRDEEEEGGEEGRGRVTGSSTAVASTVGALRKRADTISGRSFSKLLAEAHKQDFVKKRKTPAEQAETIVDEPDDDDDDDDEDDEETAYEVSEAQDRRRMARR